MKQMKMQSEQTMLGADEDAIGTDNAQLNGPIKRIVMQEDQFRNNH
jgi:hypothetical protein